PDASSRVLARRSVISHTHDVVAQEFLLVLDVFEQCLKRILYVEHAERCSVCVDHGNVLQLALTEDPPHVLQPITRMTGDRFADHDLPCGCIAAGALAAADLSYDIGLGDHAGKPAALVPNDYQV